MHTSNLVKFYQFALMILSKNGNLTSVKGHNYVTNVQKMMCNNPNQDLVNINAYTSLVKFNLFVFKMIWSKKNNLTLIKGHNSVTNLWKMTGNNPNLDSVNINAYTKFGQILSISSQDIEWY